MLVSCRGERMYAVVMVGLEGLICIVRNGKSIVACC